MSSSLYKILVADPLNCGRRDQVRNSGLAINFALPVGSEQKMLCCAVVSREYGSNSAADDLSFEMAPPHSRPIVTNYGRTLENSTIRLTTFTSTSIL